MKAIVCLDDNEGMTFAGRRQSRDRVVCADILFLTRGKKLFMNAYSRKIFDENADNIVVCEDFLAQAGKDDFCFVENCPLDGFENEIEELIVYRWNRDYPVGTKIDFNYRELNMVESSEFAGYSHEKITKEIYRK